MCICQGGLDTKLLDGKKTKGMGAPFQGSVPKWHREVVFDPSSDVIEAG